VSVTVKNTGKREGDEVVQIHVTDRKASAAVPTRKLAGFRRIMLKPGASQRLTFAINPWDLSLITDNGRRVIEPGIFDISVGGKQPGFSGRADAPTTGILTGRFTATGRPVVLEPWLEPVEGGVVPNRL
jgi:beta-glucosidase